MDLDLSHLSDVLLKHAQLQALVEAELTMLPRPLHLVVTLRKKYTRLISHLLVCGVKTDVRQVEVRRTCMTW